MSNRIRGLKAKNNGDQWETRIKMAAHSDGWLALKIPSGCKFVGKGKMIAIKSPFDFILVKDGKSIYFDAKTTSKNAFYAQMTDGNQLHWLCEIERKKCVSGFLVKFEDLNKVVFYKASQVFDMPMRSSLKPEDGMHLAFPISFDELFNRFNEPAK